MAYESEFPSNSHRSKETPKPVEPKKIERITEGAVIRRKTPLSKRFAKLFIAGDSDSVMKYVMMEVLLPGARDMVADGVTQYIERMIYGESRSVNRRPGFRPNNTSVPGYVNYSRYSAGKPSHEAPRAGISAKARATHNFDEIILASRPDAEEVIDKLFDLIAKYEQATVADLYELVGETGSFTDQKWGWRDIRDASIQRIHEGYLLRLPAPIDLKD